MRMLFSLQMLARLGHQTAEKLFCDVGNTLREANGLGPVSEISHG
jgi:hypothetical protein